MKPAAIALIGFGALFLVFTLGWYLSIAMFVLGSGLCLAIGTGFAWHGHKEQKFWIPTHVRNDSENLLSMTGKAVQIEGRKFAVQNLPPRLEFKIRCRNMHMLAVIALLGIGTTATVVTGAVHLFDPVETGSERYWLYYALCYLMAILLIPTLGWVFECALIRQPGITLASVSSLGRTRQIGYNFVDPQGGYHGGTAINFGGSQSDHLKVVLCNPKNPDANRLSCGLLFHKISWADATD